LLVDENSTHSRLLRIYSFFFSHAARIAESSMAGMGVRWKVEGEI